MSSIRNALKYILSPIVRSHKAKTRALPWPEEPLNLPTADGGGYYAATPGEVLNSQYIILRKLGWGQHSNVWLTRDNRQGTYMAIKILSAHATSAQGKISFELDLLKEIQSAGGTAGHEGFSYVVQLQDDFYLESQHGRHLCLATEVLGPSMNSVRRLFEEYKFPVHLVKDITRQLLLVLDFLHNDYIKPDNIHLAIENVETALANEPRRELPTVPDVAQFPTKPVLSQTVALSATQILTPGKLRITLADFGVAARADGFHVPIIQPVALRAPEVILGCGWGTSADIWNLGCMVFEFLTGRWLFRPRAVDPWTAEDYHLANMPPIAGEAFDIEFLRRSKHFHNYFRDDGRHLIPLVGAVDLPNALRNYHVLEEEELQICVAFLRLMLRLDPSNRATARQLLQHEWLTS
ncbi:kinase-like protein [Neolentinus lepideus HHB14362 ss-1]|uniref:non-specific serine/threonine protein kinase n=1 Tax=Neolentinus lepideus HHB14362 ss-1 TaxID=1314782 RepID=A0A165SM47_9AGAM|nr:kinase-like protein [Neolentinus lepideus HHB14362 ss-1]